MMRNRRGWTGVTGLVLALLALNVGWSQGQSVVCPAFPVEAVDVLRTSCTDLEAGQACAEEGLLALGEVAQIDQIDSDSAAPLTLLRLNAGLSEDRSLDMLLYGGVSLQAVQGEAPQLVTMNATNTAGYSLNLRRGPGTNCGEVGVFADKASLLADGRSADGQWIRVQSEFGAAWVAARLIRLEGEASSLLVAEAGPGYDEPFQQANLSMDEAQAACAWQSSGLLVRNPHEAQARLLLNGLALDFAQAAFIVRADPEVGLSVSVLQGSVQAALAGQSLSASPRQTLRAALDEDLLAEGALERADWVDEVAEGAPLALFDLSVPQEAQAPTLAPRPANASSTTNQSTFSHTFLSPQTVVYQAESGSDILSGTCNTPPIAACSHPAAIIPNANGTIDWRGQEPVPYRMQPVGSNSFVFRGRNFLNNANLSLELTLTSESTWNMTMTTVYDNDPLCNHTYYYTAVRR